MSHTLMEYKLVQRKIKNKNILEQYNQLDNLGLHFLTPNTMNIK